VPTRIAPAAAGELSLEGNLATNIQIRNARNASGTTLDASPDSVATAPPETATAAALTNSRCVKADARARNRIPNRRARSSRRPK
jgi:hypothetical protein